MQYISHYTSPLGDILLAGNPTCITGLWFQGQKYYAKGLKADAPEQELPIFSEAKNWLDKYFSDQKPGPMPPLCPKGTEFQKAVWALLLNIPYGKTTTYGELAKQLAQERALPHMSAQAVGGAVGRNPIALLIPCHRVVGADGSLTGYAGGIERKAWLLKLENGEFNV